MALRTQQVIAHESGIPGTVDPMGGSFAIEALTEEIEKEALAMIEQIEARGGVVRSITDGWQQNLISRRHTIIRWISKAVRE